MMVWNLNIQQQITPSITATVGYVGNHGVHMINRADDYNTVLPSLTPTIRLRCPAPEQRSTRLGGMCAAPWAMARRCMTLCRPSSLKRFSHGSQVAGVRTPGKDSTRVRRPPLVTIFEIIRYRVPISSGKRGRKGLTDFNVAQTLVCKLHLDFAGPAGPGAFVTGLLGGYQLGANPLTVQTGQPFTPQLISWRSTGDRSSYHLISPHRLTGPGCGNPINPGIPNGYIKTSWFPGFLRRRTLSRPNARRFRRDYSCAGRPRRSLNCSATSVEIAGSGSQLVNFDFSLFKNNYIRRISENFDIQVRSKEFIIFNHSNFESPLGNSTLFNATGAPVGAAGVINSTSTPSREAQFGVKVIF